MPFRKILSSIGALTLLGTSLFPTVAYAKGSSQDTGWCQKFIIVREPTTVQQLMMEYRAVAIVTGTPYTGYWSNSKTTFAALAPRLSLKDKIEGKVIIYTYDCKKA